VPRYGMFTASVFWRWDKVLNLGTAQSSPIRSNRLSAKPIICLSAIPNNTLIVRQSAWRCRYKLAVYHACQWFDLPAHPGAKSGRQRARALERLVIFRPVRGLVGRSARAADDIELPCWIHKMDPSHHLCNRTGLHSKLKMQPYA